MCGRFTVGKDRDEVFSETGLAPPVDWVPRYNVAPGQRVLVIRRDERGQRELARLSWGLLPSWSRDASAGHRAINARAETLELKPAFKEPFARRRCVIVADGFYEWLPTGSGKRPIYFRFREPMALAGLWDAWHRHGAAVFESVAIITVMANDVIARVSDRMPAILVANEQERWLDPQASASQLHALLRPLDPRRLEPIHVSHEVNKSLNDYASLIAPMVPPHALFELAPLAEGRWRMTQ